MCLLLALVKSVELINRQSDIHRIKEKLIAYAVQYSVDRYASKRGAVGIRKHMKVGPHKHIDKAVYK